MKRVETSTVLEKPMRFTGPMVRALLNGSKTQTRRVVKFPLLDRYGTGCEIAGCEINSCLRQGIELAPHIVGSRIWVKETFFPTIDKRHPRFAAAPDYIYRSDWDYRNGNVIGDYHWKPSIFMPRWASRITLEVTAVKVERLREITGEDAKAEGCQPHPNAAKAENWTESAALRCAYMVLWESINGKKHPWKSNPWVWCFTFKRIKPERTT